VPNTEIFYNREKTVIEFDDVNNFNSVNNSELNESNTKLQTLKLQNLKNILYYNQILKPIKNYSGKN